MNIHSPLTMVVFSFAAFVAQGARTVEFSNKAKAVHYFDSTAEWKTGSTYNVAPEEGDYVQVAALDGNSIVYLRQDTTLALCKILFKGGVRTSGTGALRFVGTGYTFLMPASDTVTYADSAIVFGTHPTTETNILFPSGGSHSLAQAKLVDADFTCGINDDAGMTSYLRFDAGTYNFCDPEGTSNGSTLNIGGAGAVTSTVTFASETSLRAYKIQVSALTSPIDAVAFNANGAAITSVGQTLQSGGAFTLTGGSLTAGSFNLQRGTFTAHAGAVLSLGTQTSGDVGGTMRLEADSQTTISTKLDWASGSLVVTGGVVSVAGSAYVGGTGNPRVEVWDGSLTAPVAFPIGATSLGTLSVKGGTFSCFSGDSITVGGSGGGGTIEVSGGSFSATRLRLARGSGSGSTLFRQTGGTARLQQPSNGSFGGIQFLQGCSSRGGTHTVELNGGTSEFRFIMSEAAPSAGTRSLFADGGTLKPTASVDNFITNLTEMALGPKGLTLDTAGYDVTIGQDVANKSGEEGFFRKTGSGTAQLIGAYAVTKTVVDGGRLLVAGEDSTFTTDLAVTNGGIFSLVGSATSASLTSLMVDHATLALDPGDVIAVSGAVDLKRLTITWSSVPTTPVSFLVVSGEISEASQVAIRSALTGSTFATGTHGKFSFDYDAETGKTTVSVVSAPDAPITASTTWTGTGAWATEANWSSGCPVETNRAAFTSATAGKTVTVASGDQAGAITFGADGYRLVGDGPLRLVGESDSLEIAATSGANEIAAPLTLSALTTVPVSAGASLLLSGNMSYGGISKSGTGLLRLTGTNAFSLGLSSADGILSIGSAAAFGSSVADEPVCLRGGTLEIDEPEGAAMQLPVAVAEDCTADSDVVVINAKTDVTLDSWNVTKGAFVKRGVGKLTVNVSSASVPVLGVGRGQDTETKGASFWKTSGIGISFPADGTTPTGGLCPGFSIAEGEMVLKGTTANARAQINATGIVGLFATTCAKQPVLTVDGVDLDCSAYNFYVGFNLLETGSGVTNATLNILNGGKVTFGSTQTGYGSTADKARVYMNATNATMNYSVDGQYLTRLWNGKGAKAVYRFKDSSLFVAKPGKIGGEIDLDFDNSVLSQLNGAPTGLSGEAARPRGTMLFRNGSLFACTMFSEEQKAGANLTLAFDNAEWRPVKDCATATIPASTYGTTVVEMRGTGVVFKPAAEATYTVYAPLTGTGGLVVNGAGTVALRANVLAYTGVSDVRQGTLDLTSVGTLESAAFTGAGTVKGLSSCNLTLTLVAADDWSVADTLTFADCRASGRLTVDFGRDAEHPLSEGTIPSQIVIGKWTGTGATPTSVRVIGTGARNLRGNVTVDGDGNLILKAYRPGLVVVFQ